MISYLQLVPQQHTSPVRSHAQHRVALSDTTVASREVISELYGRATCSHTKRTDRDLGSNAVLVVAKHCLHYRSSAKHVQREGAARGKTYTRFDIFESGLGRSHRVRRRPSLCGEAPDRPLSLLPPPPRGAGLLCMLWLAARCPFRVHRPRAISTSSPPTSTTLSPPTPFNSRVCRGREALLLAL